jgi:ribosomal protein S18 acetylase RimI-like enzyme
MISFEPPSRADLDALVALERSSFAADRLSRRSWSRLIGAPSASIVVARAERRLVGAAVVLFNRATAIARLYSLAVDPVCRGRGLGRDLLQQAVGAAVARDCALLRLECRQDNTAALRLYRGEGFAVTGRRRGFYQDGADAVVMERSLWTASGAEPPFYRQPLDFTCGPCALMMAMAALDPSTRLDRSAEIGLWREATTVFMASGHGGCSPFGLALAASRRRFRATVYAPPPGVLFVDSVRDPDKKAVIDLAERDFLDQLRRTDAEIRHQPLRLDGLTEHVRRGDMPLVMIGLWRLHREQGAHWVTVAGFDGHVLRVLDPISASGPITISAREFERISRYGRQRQAAAVVISRRET